MSDILRASDRGTTLQDLVSDDDLKRIVNEWHGSHKMPRMASELIEARSQLAAKDAEIAAAALAEREAIAKWFESLYIEESGTEYGLSHEEERRENREHNRRVMRYAAAIRNRTA